MGQSYYLYKGTELITFTPYSTGEELRITYGVSLKSNTSGRHLDFYSTSKAQTATKKTAREIWERQVRLGFHRLPEGVTHASLLNAQTEAA